MKKLKMCLLTAHSWKELVRVLDTKEAMEVLNLMSKSKVEEEKNE